LPERGVGDAGHRREHHRRIDGDPSNAECCGLSLSRPRGVPFDWLRAHIDRLRAHIDRLRAQICRLRAHIDWLRAHIDKLRVHTR
jgi:hypothetical protein